MKEIVARDQVALGGVRCLKLAIAGMSYRLFRSAITVAILALAVAFLVHMLSFSILSRSAQEGARLELADSRKLGEIVTRMATLDTRTEVQRQLVSGSPERLAEYRRFAGENVPFEAARTTAVVLDQLGRFLERLPVAMRAVLVGDENPEQLWVELENPASLKRFLEQLESLQLRLPGLTPDQLRVLIQGERPRLTATLNAIVNGHERALLGLQRRYPGQSPADLAAHPPADLPQALAEVGFGISEVDVGRLGAFSEGLRARAELRRLLLDSAVRAAVARRLGLKLSQVSMDVVVRWLDEPERAVWLAEILRSSAASFDVSAARLLELARGWDRERLLIEAAGAAGDGIGVEGAFGLDTRTRWLIVLSFIVCVVGVANAMLMSVTERFTEIATMKCLGAMDRFVMLMFVFEAMLQGVAGGLVGVVLGVLLALLRGVLDFGQLLGGALGASGELVLAGLASLLTAILLAAVAAIGPAWLASRLAPMEAMRVE
jgi:putative ABC transport system permease protein